jgi:hypothetical protein
MVDMAKRLAVFAFGLVSYVLFFLTFVYAVGFIGNLYLTPSNAHGLEHTTEGNMPPTNLTTDPSIATEF